MEGRGPWGGSGTRGGTGHRQSRGGRRGGVHGAGQVLGVVLDTDKVGVV